MTGYIPRTFIDDLLLRIDIIDVIHERVPLKKAGREFKACCPFHNEKTPSFTVSSSKQFYHCFGCGVHGNVISFLMDYEHLDFIETIESLAQSLGLEVPIEQNSDQHIITRQQKKQTSHDLYTLMREAARFYYRQLKQAPAAVNYLKQRGLSDDIIKRFGIGYAPQGWDTIIQHFSTHYSPQQLLDAGLIIRNDKGREYDRFRDRIMFPIRDHQGRIIAFGGRILSNKAGKETPKYLNSPETFIFHKGTELYGLFEAREAQKQAPQQKLQRLLVVEGYMDVIALAQYEINYALATLGTATTSDHIKKSSRLVSDIVFCFDGDKAGLRAAWRALENALPVIKDGLNLRFLFLEANEDPDTWVRQHGKIAFEAEMEKATLFSDFFLNTLQQRHNSTTREGRAALLDEALDLLKNMPDNLLRQQLLGDLSTLSHINEKQLLQHLKTGKASERNITQALSHPQRALPTDFSRMHQMPTARKAAALLLHEPSLVQLVENAEALALYNLAEIDFLTRLIESIEKRPHINAGVLVEKWRGTQHEGMLNRLIQWQPSSDNKNDLEREFQDCLRQLHKQANKYKLEALLHKERITGLSTQEKHDLLALLASK